MASDADLERLPVNSEKFRNDARRLLGGKLYETYENLVLDLKRPVSQGIFEITRLRERGESVINNDTQVFSPVQNIDLRSAHVNAISIEQSGGFFWMSEAASKLVELTQITSPKARQGIVSDIPNILEAYRKRFVQAQEIYDNAAYKHRGDDRETINGHLTRRWSTVADMQNHPRRFHQRCQEIDKFLTAKLEESTKIQEGLGVLQDQVIGFRGSREEALVLIRGILLKEISLARAGIVLGRETNDKQLASRVNTLREILADDSQIPGWVTLQIKSCQESAHRQEETADKAEKDTEILKNAQKYKKLGQGFSKVAKALKG